RRRALPREARPPRAAGEASRARLHDEAGTNRPLRAVAPTRLPGLVLDLGAEGSLGKIVLALRVSCYGTEKAIGNPVEPVRMVRAVGQRRQARPAPLTAPALEHERVVLQLDAPLGAVHLDPVAPLVGRPGEEDLRDRFGEPKAHGGSVLHREGRVA